MVGLVLLRLKGVGQFLDGWSKRKHQSQNSNQKDAWRQSERRCIQCCQSRIVRMQFISDYFMRKQNTNEKFKASQRIRSGQWLYEFSCVRKTSTRNLVRTKYSGITVSENAVRGREGTQLKKWHTWSLSSKAFFSLFKRDTDWLAMSSSSVRPLAAPSRAERSFSTCSRQTGKNTLPAMQWHAHKRLFAFLSGNLAPLFLRLQYVLNVFIFRSFVKSLSMPIDFLLTTIFFLETKSLPSIPTKSDKSEPDLPKPKLLLPNAGRSNRHCLSIEKTSNRQRRGKLTMSSRLAGWSPRLC